MTTDNPLGTQLWNGLLNHMNIDESDEYWWETSAGSRLVRQLAVFFCVHQYIEAETTWQHFTDDSFRLIFLKEKFMIFVKISLQCVPMCPNGNKSSLVQIVDRCQTGDKTLSGPMMVIFTDAHIHHQPYWFYGLWTLLLASSAVHSMNYRHGFVMGGFVMGCLQLKHRIHWNKTLY